MPQVEKIRSDVDEMLPGVIADRRHFHENPELGFHLFKTAEFVRQRLEQLGVVDIRTGIAVTGVTGLITGTAEGPARNILVRADMDALPILDEKDVDYASKHEGLMHACGHDAHTAILLGLARILTDRKDSFSGTVKLCFQPAEEVHPGGAQAMIKEGVMNDPPIEAVFGLHLDATIPVGDIHVGAGPVMAASDAYTINIQGKGGHGAYPQGCIDPVIVGTQIVSALQTVVSRNTDPMDSAVVSNSVFQSGEVSNVIPDTAILKGSVRTFKAETRDLMENRITSIATNIAEGLGATATVDYERGYPAVVNDEVMSEFARKAAIAAVGEENVISKKPAMYSDDMSYFLLEAPGSYFFVGSQNEEKGIVWGHHHPKFDIDEDALGHGLTAMAMNVLTYLGQ